MTSVNKFDSGRVKDGLINCIDKKQTFVYAGFPIHKRYAFVWLNTKVKKKGSI
jgi:hypothetical protein